MRESLRFFRSVLGAAAAACFLLIGCSEGTVSAPQGGSILLEANPTAIGLGGQSQITALVRDENGNPVRGDVEVLFFTDLGSIDRAARTNSQGIATATLTAGDTPGTATVRAVAGPNEQTIPVQIGAQAGGITLLANPDSIPNDTDSEIELVAVVRDGEGDPIEGARVTFDSELGDLESGGAARSTDESGEATDRLSVSAEEVEDRTSFGVFATTTGPDGDDLIVELVIDVESVAPNASFRASAVEGNDNAVQFENQSTGEAPLSYSWDFDDGETSNEENPLHEYDSAGEYTVELTVSNSHGEDTEEQTIDVPLS